MASIDEFPVVLEETLFGEECHEDTFPFKLFDIYAGGESNLKKNGAHYALVTNPVCADNPRWHYVVKDKKGVVVKSELTPGFGKHINDFTNDEFLEFQVKGIGGHHFFREGLRKALVEDVEINTFLND